MSEVMQKIRETEEHIKGCKEIAEFGDAILRLNSNPDFRLVIEQGYMLHEAARYVQASGDPSLTAVQRQDALNMAQASGHLKRFLSVNIQKANEADSSIAQSQAYLDELRAEA